MLAYCDKIADVCQKALLKYDPDGIIGPVGKMRFDLDPDKGFMVSTKKTFELCDFNGKKYRVIVEEV